MHPPVEHSIVWYSTVQYNAVQYLTVMVRKSLVIWCRAGPQMETSSSSQVRGSQVQVQVQVQASTTRSLHNQDPPLLDETQIHRRPPCSSPEWWTDSDWRLAMFTPGGRRLIACEALAPRMSPPLSHDDGFRPVSCQKESWARRRLDLSSFAGGSKATVCPRGNPDCHIKAAAPPNCVLCTV